MSGGVGRFVALVWLLVAAVSAMTLDEADRALASKSKSKVFQAYDTYKACFLKARIDNDAKRRVRCLKGIVDSGEKLHIDVKAYRKQLKTLASARRHVAHKKPKKTSVHVVGVNRLVSVRWESGRLVMDFSKPLGKKDVNFFRLKKTAKKGYRYVFDVHAVLPHSYALKHRDLRRVTLSQYKPRTMRLVLESSKKRTVRYRRTGKRLVVDAGLSRVNTPKKTTIVPVTAHRSRHRTGSRKVVVIDPGHGGKDPGAIGYRNYREKDVVFAIARKTAEILRKRGYTVHLTRTKDRFVKLRSRTHYANVKKADLFVSIHANAVPERNRAKANGIETYFLSRSRSSRATRAAAMENRVEIEDMNYYAKNTFLNVLNSEKIIASHKLAIDLQSSVLASLRKHYKGVNDSGVREGPFWVLVGAQMPAVLIEVGFITHPTEGKRLHDATYQARFAKGLADGIERYFAKNP